MHSYDLVIAPLIAILSASISIVVFTKKPKSQINQTTSVIVMSVAFWILFAFLADLPVMAPFSLLLNKLVFASLVVLFSSLMFLVFVFPEERHNKKQFGVLITALSAMFIYFTIWSPYVIRAIQIESFGSNLVFGKLYIVFVSYGIVSLVTSLVLILFRYKNLSEANKKSSRYFLIGLFSFMFLAFFVHVVIRTFVGSDEYYRFGNYSAIILVGFLVHAVAKYELFDIKVALTEVMVIVVLTALFVEIFLSTNLVEVITKCILFLVSTYGGYAIIKTANFERQKKLQLEIVNRKLQQLDAAKDDFINIASHQLKSPVAIMQNSLEVLDMSKSYDPDSVATSMKQVKKLNKIISEILLASKLTTKKYRATNLEEVKIEQLVKDIAKEQVAATKAQAQTVIHSELPENFVLRGDELYLGEALSNVISNALKYSRQKEENAKIELKLSFDANSKSFVFICKDNGIGMSKEDLQRVFNKFERAQNARATASGSGLGMFITKEIIEGHGGKIRIESELGVGTEAVITLPAERQTGSL